jgi:hypothetical protein
MFIGVQSPGIHVDIRVELLNGYRKTTGLKKFGE